LLGLLREDEGLANRTLRSFDITLEEVRGRVERIIGRGEEDPKTGEIPFTPRSKKVLELSLRESLALKHNYIGTEHILLGIVRENEGVAARILHDLDADADKVRNEVGRLLAEARERPPAVWEYRVEELAGETLTVELLNRFGQEGWELVSVLEEPIRAIFKRRA